MSKKEPQQTLQLRNFTHGGAREGAGRPNLRGEGAHMRRPKLIWNAPLYVILKTRDDVPSLKKGKYFQAFVEAAHASKVFYIRIVAYKVQSKTIELIVECANNTVLTQGLKSISIRLAKNINKELRKSGNRRKGSLFYRRYHLQILKEPALLWATLNKMFPLPKDKKTFDEFSSELFFASWETLYGSKWKTSFRAPNKNWIEARKTEAQKILSAPKYALSKRIITAKI